MKILYYNNCWFTNIGEAFIDIGAMALLQKIFPKAQLINISDMNLRYFDLVSRREGITNPYNNVLSKFHMFEYFSGEYFVLSGMFASNEFLDDDSSRRISEYSKQGKKIIFLGLGACSYSEKELERFKKYIEEIQPILIVSRDDITYENLKDIAPTIKGIDCAFWIKDVYDPRNATVRDYNIVAYNRSPEPEIFKSFDNIIRVYHMNWGISSKYFRDNMFMSDTPYDYLTLYANASRVYTDLVHATIASLQYGKHVKFERVDNRGYVIDAVCGKMDRGGFLYIGERELEERKKIIEEEIRDAVINISNF